MSPRQICIIGAMLVALAAAGLAVESLRFYDVEITPGLTALVGLGSFAMLILGYWSLASGVGPIYLLLAFGYATASAYYDVIWARGDQQHFIILGVYYFLMALVFVGWGLFEFVSSIKVAPRYPNLWIRLVFMLGLTVFLVHFAYPIGRKVHERDILEAKKYCEALVPQVDEVWKKTRRYPPDLQGIVPPDSPLPHLLRDQKYYASNGNKFVFKFFTTEQTFVVVYSYNNFARIWQLKTVP